MRPLVLDRMVGLMGGMVPTAPCTLAWLYSGRRRISEALIAGMKSCRSCMSINHSVGMTDCGSLGHSGCGRAEWLLYAKVQPSSQWHAYPRDHRSVTILTAK